MHDTTLTHSEKMVDATDRKAGGLSSLTLDPALPADRQTLFQTHPVLTRGFHIATPPLCRAYDEAAATIASGAPSCSFIAYPRFGKTYASEYIAARLPEAFPGTPIIRYCAYHHVHPSETSFYYDLLEQTCAERLPMRTTAHCSVLARAWWARAQECHSDRVIFLGDEMQCVTPNGYSWLIDVTNALHALNVRTVAVLFAQPELVNLRSALLHLHRGDILGRFLSRIRHFDGVRSAHELRQVLAAYDDQAEFEHPSGSGWCFTRFFVPLAFDHGWRLSTLAGQLWEQFKKLSAQRLKSTEVVQKLSVGMEWIAGSVQQLLLALSDRDQQSLAINSSLLSSAIRSSGFIDSIGLTYNPEWATPE